MKRELFEQVIKSADFLIPSIFIFIGVTGFYSYEYILYIESNPRTSPIDIAGFWLAYFVIQLFLQVVVFLNARRQINRREQSYK